MAWLRNASFLLFSTNHVIKYLLGHACVEVFHNYMLLCSALRIFLLISKCISHMKARDILNFEKLGIRKYRRTTKKGQRV